MSSDERTRDIYEGVGAYPQPPPAPLPEPGDPGELLALGIRPTALARIIYGATRSASGFRRFQRELPANLERLLRTSNLRGAHLFAPVVAASIALADDARPLDALGRAASLVLAAQSLYRDLMAGRLSPDTHRGQPLEMGLYHNLFSTSLVVEHGEARLFKSAHTATIAVAVGGQIFLLTIGAPESQASFAQVRSALADLVERATAQPRPRDEPAPGLLSAAGHDTQLKMFRQLERHPLNAESLRLLRHTFLTLCLDLEAAPEAYAEAATLAQIGNCANRWYHASLQIVVSGNAKACLVCNFNAYLDGNTMMRAAMELQHRGAACPAPGEPPLTSPPPPSARLPLSAPERGPGGEVGDAPGEPPLPAARRLGWQIDPRFTEWAERDLAPIRDPQQSCFTIAGFGRAYFSARQSDPVATFILALQLTTARLLGEPARVTQFLAMSKYRHLDVTTVDVTTPAARRFVAALTGGQPDRAETRALLQQAAAAYAQACRQARGHLPFEDQLALFLTSRTRAQGLTVSLLHGGARLALMALGLQRPAPREVLISHPEIYAETPLVGRPGIRLPYVRFFGLHYQMLEDQTTVVMMPAVGWTVPNTRLIAELCASLEQIGAILSDDERAAAR